MSRRTKGGWSIASTPWGHIGAVLLCAAIWIVIALFIY